ncbi:MAG: uroporphyrinogen methyltransferase / synthase [Gaiellaceae bacterium]|nr:uroporphyrinogen methyltransferase / synthase [Gaiellaceae bacterium]
MTVYLVGAGPGDPGLITVRGLDLVRRAEVLVYDRLAAPELVAEAPAGCERIYAGKGPSSHAMSQDAINARLVDEGAAGRRVVRLKGGDPFVFGRGSEEAEALRAAGVDYEVVPGITSAVAVPAYAGIPVTHRGLATHFTVVTGHEDPAKGRDDVDWEALARAGGTLVILMGVGGLRDIAGRLIAGGRAADTPVAVVTRGTTPRQEAITGTLETIADAAADVRPPAITVVGPVAGLRDAIAWAERRPLHGVTVAVTRARTQASELVRRLRDLGGGVVEAPVIRIEPVAGPPIDASGYDLVCLTSPNAPALLLERIGGDARLLAGVEVAAIGPGTAAAIRAIGILPDVVAERAVAEGLLEALADRVAGRRVLVARAEEARDTLPDGLREAGAATVDVVPLYRTVADVPAGTDAPAADLVTFTSSSTVRFFASAFAGQDLASVRGVSIGPVTSATMRELGIPIVAEAANHDLEGLVAAVVEAAGNR